MERISITKPAVVWTGQQLTLAAGTSWLTIASGGRLLLRRQGLTELARLLSDLEFLHRSPEAVSIKSCHIGGRCTLAIAENGEARFYDAGNDEYPLEAGVALDLYAWLQLCVDRRESARVKCWQIRGPVGSRQLVLPGRDLPLDGEGGLLKFFLQAAAGPANLSMALGSGATITLADYGVVDISLTVQRRGGPVCHVNMKRSELTGLALLV